MLVSLFDVKQYDIFRSYTGIDTYSNYRDPIVLTTNATRLYMILADEDCLMKDTDCTVMSGEP